MGTDEKAVIHMPHLQPGAVNRQRQSNQTPEEERAQTHKILRLPLLYMPNKHQKKALLVRDRGGFKNTEHQQFFSLHL